MPALGNALGLPYGNSAIALLDPLTLSPAIWLDSDAETFANNDSASPWSDRSGNARHFTEATNPPTFKTNIINGKPGIYFDGTEQLLRSYTGSGTSWSVFGVVSKDDNTFRLWWTNGIDPYVGLLSGARPTVYQGAAVQVATTVLPSLFVGTEPMGVISSAGTTKLLIGKNIWATGATTASPLKVGGLSSTGGFLWKGYMHEIVAKGAAFSNAEWSSLVDYSTAKWGTLDRRILMMDGDSITAGTGASPSSNSWAELLKAELGSTRWFIINQAASGQTVADRTAGGGPSEWMRKSAATVEFLPALRTQGKNILIAWGGTNDLFYGASAVSAFDQYKAYCQDARSAGYLVIASTMLDRNTAGGSWTRAAMTTFNTSVRSDWATFADALVDPITADSRFDDYTSALFADGVHPSNAGHALLHPLFKAALDSLSYN
jgi:lysophospholipase L1-like esterase